MSTLRHVRFLSILGLLTLAIGGSTPVQGQEVKASLRFLVDTFAVGKPIPLYMEIRHPDSVAVIFPDRKQFAPFELVSIDADPTQTTDGRSLDAAIYIVRSFEMRDTQRVNLSYGYILGPDTIWRSLNSDYVRLNYRSQPADSTENLSLKSIDDIWAMATPTDFSWVGLVIFSVLVLALLAIGLLRKPIRRILHIRRNRQEWASIRKRITQVGELEDQGQLFDQLNHLWKQYLDPGEELGLRSMTTTELRNAESFPDLLQTRQHLLIYASQLADQAIYAEELVPDEEVQSIIWELQELMREVFEIREQEIRQAKK